MASTTTVGGEEDELRAPLAAHLDIANGIWNIDIAPKLRYFLWRVTFRAIDIAENLRHQNIKTNEYCSRCVSELESSNHIFFDCVHASSVWKASGIPVPHLGNLQIPIEDKIRFYLHIYNDGTLEKHIRYLPFWIMWRSWKSRNNMVFNRKADTIADTLRNAIEDTKEWLDNKEDANDPVSTNNPSHLKQVKWKKPISGWVKCNFDASYHEGNVRSGLGWIICNSNGVFLHCAMG